MKISTIYKLGACLLLLPAIYTAFFPGKIVIVSMLCLYPISFYLIPKIIKVSANEFNDKNIINIYISLNYITFIRGVLDSKTQEDYIVLFSFTIFMLLLYPLFIYLAQSKYIVLVFNALLTTALPICFITYFNKPTDGFMSFQHNISFLNLFVFFVPFVKTKWKVIILFLLIIVPFYDISRRSSLINVSVCLLILSGYYLINFSNYLKILKFLFYILIILPVFFLVIGLGGVFNVFTIGETLDEVQISSETNERNLMTDSRTSIYVDVFTELSRQNAYLIGLGGAGKTQTSLTDNENADLKTYKEGRRLTESGMLNCFQLSGIIGAISYWLLLSYGSFKGIFRSNNDLVKILGIFMAYKVLYSFIEDAMSPNATSFYLMFMIGLCYNSKLRALNNIQIKKLSSLIFK